MTDGSDDGRSPEDIMNGLRMRATAVELEDGAVQPATAVDSVQVRGDGATVVELDLQGFSPEERGSIFDSVEEALDGMPGVGTVYVEAPPPKLEEDFEVAPAGVENVVTVANSKGGVGKSSVALALAKTMSEQGFDAGVFDADVQASDLIEMVDVEGPIAATSDGRPIPEEDGDVEIVGVDLVMGDRPMAWRGATTYDAVKDLYGGARWTAEHLVVDLPPGLGAEADTVLRRTPVDSGVVVTTGSDSSIRNAVRTVSYMQANDVPVTAVVENMSGDGLFDGGSRDVEEVLEVVDDDVVHVSVSVDSGVAAAEPQEFGGKTREAFEALADAVTGEELEDGELPKGTVDLRGLPRERQIRCLEEEEVPNPDGYVVEFDPDEEHDLGVDVEVEEIDGDRVLTPNQQTST